MTSSASLMTKFPMLVFTSWSTGFLLALTLAASSLWWSFNFFTRSNGMFSLVGSIIAFSFLDNTFVHSWVSLAGGKVNLVMTIDDFEDFLIVFNDFSSISLYAIGSANCLTGLHILLCIIFPASSCLSSFTDLVFY